MSGIVKTFRTALHALRRNVMRSILTCLGIIIGVAAVIAMVEIGQGSSDLIQQSISKLGANVLLVFPGQAASGGVSFGGGSSLTLTAQDCEALRECTALRGVAPVVGARMQLVYGNKNWVPQNITGTTPEYLDLKDWSHMAAGEAFTDRDVRNASRVCLLGSTIVRELFGQEEPVGKQIRVHNVDMKVIGVLEKKGANMGGWDQDDCIIIPWTTVKYRLSNSKLQQNNQSAASTSSDSLNQVNTLKDVYPNQSVQLYPQQSAVQQADQPQPIRFPNIDQIFTSARSAQDIPLAMKQIAEVLRERHRLQESQPDDFNVRDMTELAQSFAHSSDVMKNLLLCVAMISLFVGGVGIMNIMLVSVTERTREIGLRMAVGARARDILYQFLVEAVVLCLMGGALGILMGRGGSVLVTMLMHWPTKISVAAIIVAVVVSASVGMIFGFYPAWKASSLDPIEALRYE